MNAKAHIAGFVLRSDNRVKTAEFYRALGLIAQEHSHGGPVHFELGPTDPSSVTEIYKRTQNFPADTLMIEVESLADTLTNLNISAEIRIAGDMRLAYIKDPDERSVMIFERVVV